MQMNLSLGSKKCFLGFTLILILNFEIIFISFFLQFYINKIQHIFNCWASLNCTFFRIIAGLLLCRTICINICMRGGRRAVLFSENVDKISSTCPLVVHIIYSYPVKTEVHFIRNSIERRLQPPATVASNKLQPRRQYKIQSYF